MKKQRLHIQRITALIMLCVFSLALTPWSALHHHETVAETPVEKNCTHKFHVKTQQETCLICKAHFEKNFTISPTIFFTYREIEVKIQSHPIVSSSFTALISTSLRGPPSVS